MLNPMIKMVRLLLLFTLYSTNALAASSPDIVVSIKPFYNITAKVMESVGKPQLLLTQNASPHDYQLKPSDAKLINDSDLVIWGGPELDGYLAKSVSSLANRELDLAQIPGLTLLEIRSSSNWELEDEQHVHNHGVYDAHFWLDPDNAIIIASAIAQRLGEIDPKHAKIYAKNATEFSKQINQDKQVWAKELAPFKNKPYVVSHDAYQYFNKFFGLDGVGAISLHPEIPPSVKRVQQIQSLLEGKQVQCIYREPQFNYKVIKTLIAGTKIHEGELDPLGQDKDLGPNGYITLMNNLVHDFTQCYKH